MANKIIFLLLFALAISTAEAQQITTDLLTPTLFPTNNGNTPTPSKVDFDAYLDLVKTVQVYRQNRMLHLDSFMQLSQQQGVVILDTRSKAMYDAKHVKGAINLNFADFTQENLAKIIPNFDTKILIYCNNNFSDEPIYFPTKEVRMLSSALSEPVLKKNATKKEKEEFARLAAIKTKEKEERQVREKAIEEAKIQSKKAKETALTLALNIPTFINLYGYGYKNVFELADLVSVHGGKIAFEGSAVGQ